MSLKVRDLYRYNLDRISLNESPERKLVLAVLEDALNEYFKNMNKENHLSRKHFNMERNYFFREDFFQESYSFSARNVCNYLGINLDYLRKGLRKIEKENSISIKRKRVRYKSRNKEKVSLIRKRNRN